MTDTPTQHTDEPSVDELKALCGRLLETPVLVTDDPVDFVGGTRGSFNIDEVVTVVKALQSRLKQ